MKENLLTFGTPEQAGIPSAAIESFLRIMQEKGYCLHGFLLWRKGQVVAEGYAPPFHKDRKHRMYSISKTFVSAAIGLLIDAGELSLSDKVADFFPSDQPAELHPLIAMATVQDLLCMATPFHYNTYGFADSDWVKTFFHASPSVAPGTIFAYNTAATVVLNALAEKLSGKLLLDSMREKLLDPIGFSPDADCILRPEGGAWGGSGVLCTLRDLTKFALVFLHNGQWEGKQLLSAKYVQQATACQIATEAAVSNESESYGYGFQIWRTAKNGFAMHGMGGQMALCLPEQDLVLTTIADMQSFGHSHDTLSAFWETIFPALQENPLPADPQACDALRRRAQSLALPLPKGKASSPLLDSISGRKYIMEDNPMHISKLCFRFDGEKGALHYTNKSGDHEIAFGLGQYLSGAFPEPGYAGRQIGVPGNLYACDAAGMFQSDDTLLLHVYITDDYLGLLRAQFCFRDGSVSVAMRKVAENFLNEYQGYAFGTAVDCLGCSCFC